MPAGVASEEYGVEQYQRQTAQEGEQTGAEVEPSRWESSLGALSMHGNPDQGTARTETTTQRLGEMNGISPKDRWNKAAWENNAQTRHPAPLPEQHVSSILRR